MEKEESHGAGNDNEKRCRSFSLYRSVGEFIMNVYRLRLEIIGLCRRANWEERGREGNTYNGSNFPTEQLFRVNLWDEGKGGSHVAAAAAAVAALNAKLV